MADNYSDSSKKQALKDLAVSDGQNILTNSLFVLSYLLSVYNLKGESIQASRLFVKLKSDR